MKKVKKNCGGFIVCCYGNKHYFGISRKCGNFGK